MAVEKKSVSSLLDVLYTGTVPLLKGSPEAAGIDIPFETDVVLKPEFNNIQTSFCFNLPKDTWLMVALRSSAGKKGLIYCGSQGVVDSDFTEPISLWIWNMNKHDVEYKKGESACQAIMLPIYKCNFFKTEVLPNEIPRSVVKSNYQKEYYTDTSVESKTRYDYFQQRYGSSEKNWPTFISTFMQTKRKSKLRRLQ